MWCILEQVEKSHKRKMQLKETKKMVDESSGVSPQPIQFSADGNIPALQRKLVVPMAIEKTRLPRNSTHSAHLVVVYPNGDTEQFEGNAIVNRIPCGARLLTVAKFISKLGLPSSMPTQRRSYTFSRKVWLPNVKAAVEFNLPPPEPISKKALETMKRVVTKWIREPAIPRKRKKRSV
jgi:hypothetical protein